MKSQRISPRKELPVGMYSFPRAAVTKHHKLGVSLVVQLLRIHLPMRETQVRLLVGEDPTCHGATKPVRHNY